MQYFTFNYYVNEFGKYLFISQRILHGVLWRRAENAVTLPHIAQRKNAFLGGIKQMSKSEKIEPRKKVILELLHHRLGHRYTISLMIGDTANV